MPCFSMVWFALLQIFWPWLALTPQMFECILQLYLCTRAGRSLEGLLIKEVMGLSGEEDSNAVGNNEAANLPQGCPWVKYFIFYCCGF